MYFKYIILLDRRSGEWKEKIWLTLKAICVFSDDKSFFIDLKSQSFWHTKNPKKIIIIFSMQMLYISFSFSRALLYADTRPSLSQDTLYFSSIFIKYYIITIFFIIVVVVVEHNNNNNNIINYNFVSVLFFQIIVVPHSHNDPGWLRTFEGYYHLQTSKVLNYMVEKMTVLKNMTFVWSEISFLALWWER